MQLKTSREARARHRRLWGKSGGLGGKAGCVSGQMTCVCVCAVQQARHQLSALRIPLHEKYTIWRLVERPELNGVAANLNGAHLEQPIQSAHNLLPELAKDPRHRPRFDLTVSWPAAPVAR
eukprot:11679-Chlamydomonas_euryale.AAC.4